MSADIYKPRADFMVMTHEYAGENNIEGAARSPESSIGWWLQAEFKACAVAERKNDWTV